MAHYIQNMLLQYKVTELIVSVAFMFIKWFLLCVALGCLLIRNYIFKLNIPVGVTKVIVLVAKRSTDTDDL
jgi:hypothetical protein